jgi:hypothetical protein
MFALASEYRPGTLGREGVWIYFLGLGLMTALVGFRQPPTTSALDETIGQSRGWEDQQQQGIYHEESSLLPSPM